MMTSRNRAPAWLSLVFGLLLGLCGMAAQAADSAAAEQAARQLEQPFNNAPVWREVRSGEAHTTVMRGAEAGVLVNSGGQTWRALRNGPVIQYGGSLLLAMFGVIALFYLVKGPLKLHEPPSGRHMQRFSPFERFVHWGTAISFVLMALTGLAILFGKYVIAPVIGVGGLATLLSAGKLVHNYLGPVFLAFTLLMVFAYARDNVWQACDSQWIGKAGGLLSGEHVPSGRFNFGEKTWFWIGVTLLGLIVAGSGLVANFPNYGQTRDTMQTVNLIHSIAAVILTTLSLGHIYMGTIGVKGAFESMKTGKVDETWAKEHHRYWYDDVKAGKSGHP